LKRRHNHVRSQWIAAGVSFAAVMVMLAPLRQGPAGMRTQHASFIPLLAASPPLLAPHRRCLAGSRMIFRLRASAGINSMRINARHWMRW
jgi:hypothetical protein